MRAIRQPNILTTKEELGKWRDRYAGRLVATNGCFDLLHVGHVRFLQEAKSLGDALMVGVNDDRSVKALKGQGRPVNSEWDRAEVLAALECVDVVAIFHDMRATTFLTHARPHIWAKGGDYNADSLDQFEVQAVMDAGGRCVVCGFEEGYSTTSTLELMQA